MCLSRLKYCVKKWLFSAVICVFVFSDRGHRDVRYKSESSETGRWDVTSVHALTHIHRKLVKRRQAECVNLLGIVFNEFALDVMFTSGSTCKQLFLWLFLCPTVVLCSPHRRVPHLTLPDQPYQRQAALVQVSRDLWPGLTQVNLRLEVNLGRRSAQGGGVSQGEEEMTSFLCVLCICFSTIWCIACVK